MTEKERSTFFLLSFDVSGLESDFLKGWEFGRNILLK
jgi:hypothetical protein